MGSLKNRLLSSFAALFVLTTSVCFASGTPALGLNAEGYAVGVWQTYTFSGTVIQANIFDTSSWGNPLTISSSIQLATDPHVAVKSNGTDIAAVAIWSELNGSVTSVYASMLASISAGWSTIAQVSSNAEDVLQTLNINLNDSGVVMLTWSSMDSIGNQYIRTATSVLDSSNSWSSPLTISGP
jgi:hypothetical protein